MKNRIALEGEWTLRQLGGHSPDVPPIVVEGANERSVYGSLLTSGLIADPFVDANEDEVSWVAHADWELSRRLPALSFDGAVAELELPGVDTFATVHVGESRLGSTSNMHCRYVWDMSEALRADDDQLIVRFESPYAHAAQREAELGHRPASYPSPYPYVRKMACSFGWDWGPSLPDFGLWRGASLLVWRQARLDRVAVSTREEGGAWVAEVHVEVKRQEGVAARRLFVDIELSGPGIHEVQRADVAEHAHSVEAAIVAASAAPWFPRGMGVAQLYELTVRLLDETGEPLDETVESIGFRTINISANASGEFGLDVNGVPVLARGFNWIPESILPGLTSERRVEGLLEAAVAANANLVRVWGGGLYESDHFYRRCDELGLLVWQDFAFACGTYPEEGALPAEVEREVVDNVRRISSHPSLALLCGNNENLWLYKALEWDRALDGASWGAGYYFDLIPRLISEIAPHLNYYPGTPWSGDWSIEPNDPGTQTHHAWEMWNHRDYTRYLDDEPRFVSEFGWQGPASYAVLRNAVSTEIEDPEDRRLQHHQKADNGEHKLREGVARHLPPSTTLTDWHYASSLVQTRAIATALSHWARLWPSCRGAVIWQLNDIWPSISWSALDVDTNPKPVMAAIRDAFDDVHLSFSLDRWERPELFIHNRGVAGAVEGTVRITLLSADGATTEQRAHYLRLAPSDHRSISVSDATALRDGVVRAEYLGRTRYWWADPDGRLGIEDPGLEWEIREGDAPELILTARHAIAREVLVRTDLDDDWFVPELSRFLTVEPLMPVTVPLEKGTDTGRLARAMSQPGGVTSLADYLSRNAPATSAHSSRGAVER